ncbi:hypothetical protein B0I08_108165 [Glaciihabitans tibetensis]|uniref:Uncharacterized protein n=1 Tax=Glaciihabitans tibetensis TaxID=1266600 RepID=A0A2T0VAK7_9MICO|nr:hypothetical protein [Glaciihabitans tibetensis]PRY67077.1 hypothetical protein B0I08_108165 [Glaciihabitans tibetensis]
MKRLWVWFAALAGIGLLVVIVLTVISGAQYRSTEEQGLDPIYAADWIVAGTYAGMALFAVGLIALAVTGIVAFVRQRRSDDQAETGH